LRHLIGGSRKHDDHKPDSARLKPVREFLDEGDGGLPGFLVRLNAVYQPVGDYVSRTKKQCGVVNERVGEASQRPESHWPLVFQASAVSHEQRLSERNYLREPALTATVPFNLKIRES
jgi:hypothetical protein